VGVPPAPAAVRLGETPTPRKMKLSPLKIILSQVALLALSIIFCAPFAWVVSTSFKVPEKLQSAGMEFIPRASYIDLEGQPTRVKPLGVKDGMLQVQLQEGSRSDETISVDPSQLHDRVYFNVANYTEAFEWFPFTLYLKNTLVICLICVLGTLLSCSLVAYGLACVEWRGREFLFWLMLSTMMLPPQVTMIPLFLTFKHLGWINTILPLVVPAFFGNAFFIFLLRQFYRTVPQDLIEAARLDGCGELAIWARIMLPLSKPALAVVALFTFMWTWNDFLNPLIYLMEDRKYTLSIGLAMFQGQYHGEWGQMMAMAGLMTLPIIVLFFLAQKQFIQGVKMSGIKG
jgi:multiple sugar transport system permease protein